MTAATLRRRTIAYAVIDIFGIAFVLGWSVASGASRRETCVVVALVVGINLAFDIARLAPAWWRVRGGMKCQ